jgi:hypothetical protein
MTLYVYVGEECSPGCSRHLSHPCERCGRYAAGLRNGPDADASIGRIISEAVKDERTFDLVEKYSDKGWTDAQLLTAICMRLLHEVKQWEYQ